VTPCIQVEVHPNFGGTHCLHLRGRDISQASSQQKANGMLYLVFDTEVGAVLSSETSVNLYKITRIKIREDGTLYNHHRENICSLTGHNFTTKLNND
jgi:hypothetical protein